jgi:hypothetical protein
MIRPRADNVILILDPANTVTKSAGGVHLVSNSGKQTARGSRWATVYASGPGYWLPSKRKLAGRDFTVPSDVFVPNETRPGDRVLIDADAGQDYRMDISIPRHNVGHDFEELCGAKGEFRIVREDECLLLAREGSSAAE